MGNKNILYCKKTITYDGGSSIKTFEKGETYAATYGFYGHTKHNAKSLNVDYVFVQFADCTGRGITFQTNNNGIVSEKILTNYFLTKEEYRKLKIEKILEDNGN